MSSCEDDKWIIDPNTGIFRKTCSYPGPYPGPSPGPSLLSSTCQLYGVDIWNPLDLECTALTTIIIVTVVILGLLVMLALGRFAPQSDPVS